MRVDCESARHRDIDRFHAYVSAMPGLHDPIELIAVP